MPRIFGLCYVLNKDFKELCLEFSTYNFFCLFIVVKGKCVGIYLFVYLFNIYLIYLFPFVVRGDLALFSNQL